MILLGLNLAGVLIHATALVANLARGACAEAMASATLLAFSGTAACVLWAGWPSRDD